MSVLRPGDGEFARKVLEALGDEVEVIEGLCCGQPGFNSGFRDEARDVARGALRVADQFDQVVVPSGSCTSMLRHYLPMLYEGDRREAATARVERFSEFVSYVANHPERASLRFALDGVVAYHDSCHGRRELGITGTVKDLLRSVDGLEVRELVHEDECCGFGGTFRVKQPEVSRLMAESKLRDMEATGAQVLVSADLSCLGHLEGIALEDGRDIETWTVAELLGRALV